MGSAGGGYRAERQGREHGVGGDGQGDGGAQHKATDEITAATETQAASIKLRKEEEPKDTMEMAAPELAKVVSAELSTIS